MMLLFLAYCLPTCQKELLLRYVTGKDEAVTHDRDLIKEPDAEHDNT